MEKNNLNALLDKLDQTPIRRGKGVTLSIDHQSPTADPTGNVQNGRTAVVQNNRNAGKTRKVIRPSKGYMIRSDIDKECKVLAAEKGRPLYEIMEEALITYLKKHGKNIS